MKAKSIARRNSPGAPTPPPSSNVRVFLVPLIFLVAGAVGALAIERMPAGPIAAPTRAPSAAPSETALDSLPPDASTQPEPSVDPSAGSPEPSPSPASPQLEAAMPHTVGTSALTVTSARGAAALGNTPAVRALAAAAGKLGKSIDSLELGYGYDETGALDINILAFRIEGVPAATLEPIVLDAWLSTTAPGVVVTKETVAGHAVTHVAYGDEGPEEWVVTKGDAVFVIETQDKALAQTTLTAVFAPPGTPAPSGSAAAGSPSAAPSTPPSAAASPSGS